MLPVTSVGQTYKSRGRQLVLLNAAYATLFTLIQTPNRNNPNTSLSEEVLALLQLQQLTVEELTRNLHMCICTSAFDTSKQNTLRIPVDLTTYTHTHTQI